MSVPPARPNSSLAIVSLIFGVLSWVALPIIGALVAIIAGHSARSEIRASQGAIEGDGFALAGLILGWVHLLLMVVIILVIMLFLGGLAFFAAHT